MKEVKWTGGRWAYVDHKSIRELFNGCAAIISDEVEDAVVATIGEDVYDSVANAHLIAAAPELYEALEAFVKKYESEPLTDEYEWGVAILAKARGENQPGGCDE